jgi:ketosteroid isomerase-like protein
MRAIFLLACAVFCASEGPAPSAPPVGVANEQRALSRNKQTVENYMEGFRQADHTAILSCLTDDVEWVIPGMFRIRGKEAFDKEVENPAFVGKPVIAVSRMTEENDVVIAEGTVRATKRSGEVTDLAFCDVFEMRDGKVKRLISYLMEVKAPAKAR